MAEIVKARALELPGQPAVAVKRILPHLAADPEFVTMFLDESRVLSRLNHPNIVRTLDVGVVDELPYLALEYVDGKDARMLFHACRKRSEQPPQELACYILMQVLAGLDYAHDFCGPAGEPLALVHRDVSLQNILLSFRGDVKLADFGIARSADNQSKTEAGVVKGKFGYMSPEQVRSRTLDRRSDVFAAGICLHELLTCQRLFGGELTYENVERVRNVSIAPPSSVNQAVSPALEHIVMRALAKEPEDRYPTAAAMRSALFAFLEASDLHPTRGDLADYLRRFFQPSEPEEVTRIGDAFAIDPLLRATRDPSAVGPTQDFEEEVTWVAGSHVLAGVDQATSGPRAPRSQRLTPRDDASQRLALSPASAKHRSALQEEVLQEEPTLSLEAVPHLAWQESRGSGEPTGGLGESGSQTATVSLRWGALGLPALAVLVAAAVVGLSVLVLLLWPAGEGELVFVTEPPDARVSVDGGPLIDQSSPYRISGLRAGQPHVIRVSSPGYHEWTARLVINEHEILHLPPIRLLRETQQASGP